MTHKLDIDAVDKADTARTQGNWGQLLLPLDYLAADWYTATTRMECSSADAQFIALMSVQAPLMVARIRGLEEAAQIVVESEGWHGIEELRKVLNENY